MFAGSSRGTRVPVTPAWINSGLPPTEVASTGSPHAIASSIVLEMPSASDGSTNRSKLRIIRATSSRLPGSHAYSPIPASASSMRTSSRSGPSPTMTNRNRCSAPGIARMSRRQHSLERANVASMDDVRAQAIQQPPQPELGHRAVARRFVEGQHGNVATRQTLTELRVARQTDDRMAKALRGNTIDQIYQSVFEPTHVQAMDDVSDQGNIWHTSCRM